MINSQIRLDPKSWARRLTTIKEHLPRPCIGPSSRPPASLRSGNRPASIREGLGYLPAAWEKSDVTQVSISFVAVEASSML